MPPKLVQQNKEQEEQKIFKEFEELGYRFRESSINKNVIAIECFEENSNVFCKNRIWITKSKKSYWVGLGNISMQVHQLLHKLFKIWGWFDD